MMSWYDVKRAIEIASGLHMDALHIYAGVLGQILAALLLRRSLASGEAWLLVLIIALGNEWYDLAYDPWPDRAMQYGESIRDVWNTMLLPSLLLLLIKIFPELFRSAGDHKPNPGS